MFDVDIGAELAGPSTAGQLTRGVCDSAVLGKQCDLFVLRFQ
jgi:hypothetical protein